MIFKGEIAMQRTKRLAQWHTTFAWFPMQMETGEWVWLESYSVRVWKNGHAQRRLLGQIPLDDPKFSPPRTGSGWAL